MKIRRIWEERGRVSAELEVGIGRVGYCVYVF